MSKATNLLEGKRFYITGSHKPIKQTSIEDFIKSLGGFVYKSDSACLPDHNYKNFPSFVIVPTSLSSKGKLPKGGQHIIKVSKKLEAPIIKSDLFVKIAEGELDSFPESFDEFLWKHPLLKGQILVPPPSEFCEENLWGIRKRGY